MSTDLSGKLLSLAEDLEACYFGSPTDPDGFTDLTQELRHLAAVLEQHDKDRREKLKLAQLSAHLYANTAKTKLLERLAP